MSISDDDMKLCFELFDKTGSGKWELFFVFCFARLLVPILVKGLYYT